MGLERNEEFFLQARTKTIFISYFSLCLLLGSSLFINHLTAFLGFWFND